LSLTFFASDRDLAAVWRIVFETPGMKVLEHYSVPDQPNRWFESIDDIVVNLESPNPSLAAWFEPTGGRPRAEKIVFTADARTELRARGRTVLNSPALISIHRNGEQEGCLASTTISSWTEKGVRERSRYSEEFINEVDWRLFRSTVGRLERQIKKSAPARMRAYPVLQDAYSSFVNGDLKLWNWGEAISHPSPLVIGRAT
jgi:hypothetical protein